MTEPLVKAGRLFCVSEGSYSDYGINAFFVALEDITTELFQSIIDDLVAKAKTLDSIAERGDKPMTWAAPEYPYYRTMYLDERFLPALAEAVVAAIKEELK